MVVIAGGTADTAAAVDRLSRDQFRESGQIGIAFLFLLPLSQGWQRRNLEQ